MGIWQIFFLTDLKFFPSWQDIIILNKVDLVSPDELGLATSHYLEDLEKDIRNINSLAAVIRSVRCQVDLSKILECQAYDAAVSQILLIFRTK